MAVLDIQDAISLLEQREPRKAAQVLEQIVEEMPVYATARVLLARCYEALDDWDLALGVWQEALQLVPNSPVARHGLERTVARSGSMRRRERAEAEASAALNEPSSGDAAVAAEEDEQRSKAENIGGSAGTPEPPDEDSAGTEGSPATIDSAPEQTDEAGSVAGAEAAPESAAPELRAQDVPLPTHLPPRPRESLESPPHRDSAEPPPPTESIESPRPPESIEPRPAESIESQPPPESIEPPRPGESTEPPPGESTEPPPGESTEPPPRQDASDPPDELAEEFRDMPDTGTPHYEDLDRLISELESARIVPRPDLESVPSPDLEDDIEDVVSETLARIYASQGQYDEAARVYELLAGQHPEEADDYLQKASYMRSRASDGL